MSEITTEDLVARLRQVGAEPTWVEVKAAVKGSLEAWLRP